MTTDRTHEPSQDQRGTAREPITSPTPTDKTPDLGELVGRVTAYADGFILVGGGDFAAIGHAIHDALAALEARAEALEKELAKAREWSPNDREDQWTPAIRAAHPMRSDDPKVHDHFGTAMDMVGGRRSKFALVELVSWLIGRADKAEAEVAGLKARVAEVLGDLDAILDFSTPADRNDPWVFDDPSSINDAMRRAADLRRATLTGDRT